MTDPIVTPSSDQSQADVNPAVLAPAAEQPLLFSPGELQASAAPALAATPAGDPPAKLAPRINRPERCQGEMRSESLDQRLEPEHPARLVWAYVEGLDLTELLDQIKAVETRPGRNATDVRVLFALLLLAAIDGVRGCRELDRLSQNHRAYEWLRGGVSLNYHMLSDFRSEHEALLDRLLSESLACLMNEGLINLETTAQDGMKVRASAGGDSFRREATLQEHLEKAEQHVAELKAQADDPNIGQQTKKARERGAREKLERLQSALKNREKLAASREARKAGDGVKTRVSSTDPDARIMQMPDGGFRPALNVQFTTTTDTKIIVAVDVINQGNDAGQIQPMIEQVQERLGDVPDNHLVDGGFTTKKDIEETTKLGTTVYAPVKEEEQQKAKGQDPFQPRKGDSASLAAWRIRMGTTAAKELYKLRGETAEWVNACMRNRGMQQFLVRGLAKVRAVVLMSVLAHNLLRAEVLRVQKRLSEGIPCA